MLGLSYREVAEITGATTRTAQRWGNAADATLPRRERRTKVDELRELLRLLAVTFPRPADALEWLHREVPLLEQRRPIDLIRRGEVRPVVAVLAGAYAGAFA